jgi:hypothetical protein
LKRVVVSLLALLVAACGKTPEPAKQPEQNGDRPQTSGSVPAFQAPASSDTAPAEGASMKGQGVDLRLFDASPTQGGSRKPTFWVHADTFSLGEKNLWTFEKARAVVYARNEEDPQVTFEAGSGQFQETKGEDGKGGMAFLRGGVTAQVGPMRLQLSDIEWVNDERTARSDSPVTITSEDSNLSASSVRLYPDQKQLVMTNVTGELQLERNQP